MLNKLHLYNFIGILIFKILLDYMYISFVSKIFAYMGFRLDINLLKYLIGWIVYIVIYLILSTKEKVYLYPILLLSFLLVTTPTTTLYGLANRNHIYFFIIVITFFLLIYSITVKKIRLKKTKISKNIIIVLMIFIVFLVVAHYVSINGFNHLTLDFSKVYELRREMGEKQNTGLFGYLNNWTIKFFNIYLISFYLYKKKYILSSFFIFIQIYLFTLSGHKSVLVNLFLVGLIYFIFKYKNQTTILIYSLVGFLVLNIMYIQFAEDILLPSILIRRAFFIPADLNFLHIEFFTNHMPLYWSNSILKYFINYPYDIPATHIVSQYIGEPGAASNTGFIGSGYMHFPYLGNLIYVALLSLIINIMNSLNGFPRWFLNAMVMMPLLTALISADLMIALLTHGLLITVIIMYLTQERIKI